MTYNKSSDSANNQQNHNVNIIGSVERITFHSADTGFCVLRIIIANLRELVTVVGNISQINVGSDIEVNGVWITDKTYGKQLKASSIKLIAPTSIAGITKYLASGLIKGVGKHFAKLLVDKFGTEILTILDNDPAMIKQITGIGEKRANNIINSWQEQKVIREIMLFLHQYGVGVARAFRIHKTYGDHTIKKLTENPYILSLDIWGIGFKTADNFANKLGITKDSVVRIEAGIRQVLNVYSTFGHCAILPNKLIEETIKLLEDDSVSITDTMIETAIHNQLVSEHLIKYKIKDDDYIYLAQIYNTETGIINNLIRIMSNITSLFVSDDQVFAYAHSSIKLSHYQRVAILTVIRSKISIITGGPGTGKTTIIKNILQILQKLNQKIILTAPTGRATKKLSESTNFPAKTIHRLLEYRPGQGARYNQDNQLDVDYLIIDEVSMVDIFLMNTLLKAIPNHTAILFVGDIDQLPSVGPGAVLKDLIDSMTINTTALTEIFRQEHTSSIITNAHRINQGKMPYCTNLVYDDFFYKELDDDNAIIEHILKLTVTELPNLHNINAVTDIQILSPMNKGSLGVHNLNNIFQQALNVNIKSNIYIKSMGVDFYLGDKVMQIVNNYDKEVFNGDIGFIVDINHDDDIINIKYDERIVEYSSKDLDEITLAYAISIHKSQGSEYPIVIIPITMQHYPMLQRNLIYTGVTRGKKIVILVGEKRAIYKAVSSETSKQRITGLGSRLSCAHQL